MVAALAVAASLLSARPAAGLTLVSTILDLASSLELSMDDEDDDYGLAVILRVLPALQGLQNVIVSTRKIETRRQGYSLLKKIIQDVLPDSIRLQCLQMLINECSYPSLVSLHLNLLKDEVARAWPSSSPQSSVTSPFVGDDVLEAIESVLRPHDRAPELPAQIDPVQSALNLYRFILIRESTGKTNHTGVLSKEVLRKARTEWLLPLLELAGQLNLEVMAEDDEMFASMSLAVDNLRSVLYRCLELNEEALAQF